MELAGYLITEPLHQGARTAVYRAVGPAGGPPVVLKLPQGAAPAWQQVAALRHEHELLQLLDFPGVPRVYALASDQDRPVLVLEDIGGRSLDRLPEGRCLDLDTFLAIAVQAAEHLHEIHRRGVIHQALAPANLVYDGAAGRLQIIDFGRAAGPGAVPRGEQAEGDLAFLAPEQTGRTNRAVDYRSDFYALGATFYQLLAGRPPFAEQEPLALIHCHLALEPRPPHEVDARVPPAVSRVVTRLLAKAPEDRYQSAAGLAADLRSCRQQWRATGRVAELPPAGREVADRLQLSRRLYGRARELDVLQEAYARVARGGREVVLVEGQSGVGKSSLVQEILPAVAGLGGFVAAGRCERHRQNRPYSAVVEAFGGVVRRLLSGSQAELAGWALALGTALGANGGVLTALLPDVAGVMGPQPDLPGLPAAESRERFQRAFLGFCRLLARPEHPLVLFLDDLQWADAPTLELVELLATDEDMASLLVVGTCRDGEAGPAHPLRLALARVRQQGAAVGLVDLQPLARADLARLIADACGVGLEPAGPLADVLLAKTHGNPFFVNQMLASLQQQGLIRLDPAACAWAWDLEAIRRREVTGNVADLMAARLGRLAEPARQALQVAACLGSRFDLATLALARQQPLAAAAADLAAALQEGLILPAEGDGAPAAYCFLHDQVQQAAAALIPAERRPEVHLAIGRRLLAATAAEGREERLFEIANHLNRGAGLLHDEQARAELLAINRSAAGKARQAVAFATALGYLQEALALLPPDAWRGCYDLALGLHLEAAEAACLAGEYEAVARYSGQILAHAASRLDLARAYEARIEALAAGNQHPEAVETGLAALALMGIRIPLHPGRLAVLAAVLRARWALAGKTAADLARLPPMADPAALAIMRLLSRVSASCYLGDPACFALVVLRQVALSARHGHAPGSAQACALYGVMLGGPIGDIPGAGRFGQLALALLDRCGDGREQARVRFTVNMYTQPLQEHLRASLGPLLDASRAAAEAGDRETAAFALAVHALYGFWAGRELAPLARELAAADRECGRMRQETPRIFCRILQPTILALSGEAGGRAFSEQDLPAGRDPAAWFFYYLHRMQLEYLLGDPGRAEATARLAEQQMAPIAPAAVRAGFYFYDVLIQLALCRPGTRPDRRRLRRVAAGQRQLGLWDRHAPMNFRHKLLLVAAERARVEGRDADAVRDYEQAMTLARDHEYVQDQALAAELAAGYYAERGALPAAASYLAIARLAYARWGATAKVRQLDARFPGLPAAAAPRGAADEETLDFASILQASQAISGDIQFEGLLHNLMRIATVNAGAQRGCLLLHDGSRLVLTAEHAAGREDVALLSPAPLEATGPDGLPRVPAALVRLAAHTLRPLVLDDASRAEAFATDPYVAARRPRSVLCLPLLHQGGLVGVLYLENNLAAGAFTARRLEVLQHLSAQMAISVSNAALYRDLEQATRQLAEHNRTLEEQVRARTREVEEANRLLLQQMEQREQLLRDVSHELRSPLTRLKLAAGLMAAKDRVQPYVGELRTNMQEMETLIDEILELLRAQVAPGQDLERVDLAGLAAELAEQRRHLLADRGLRLATELGPAPVLGDRRLLARALGNLLDNAIKYTPAGGTIRLATARDGARCAVRVEDDGPGISAEHLPNICEPFYRADSSRSRATGGSGLGLAIVKAVADRLQGALRVQSAEGQGTRVEISFPSAGE